MYLVKITKSDDGTKVHKPCWHYAATWGDSDRTLCSGEAFGEGEGEAEYKTKPLSLSGITCKICKSIIQEIKSISNNPK